MSKVLAMTLGAILAASASGGSHAQSVTAVNPAQYGMGQYLSEGRYRSDATLRSRCLSEEKAGRLTTTCKQYKHELNRLVRARSTT